MAIKNSQEIDRNLIRVFNAIADQSGIDVPIKGGDAIEVGGHNVCGYVCIMCIYDCYNYTRDGGWHGMAGY